MAGGDRSRCSGGLSLVVVLLLVGCSASGGAGEATTAPEDGGASPSASLATPTTPPCRPASLETRAATVLVVGIGNATTADDPLAAQVAGLGLGGVLMLGPNVVDPGQVRALIEGLRQLSPRPLLVSVDEEGGRVSRLRRIIGTTPSARALGQRSLPEIADVAAERGATLRDLGFDLVLAPVVDADGGARGGAIGDRAFAATPAEAGPRAGAFAEGLARAGVAATAKHFPGQGGLADSHGGPVVAEVPRSELTTAAAAAFRPALDAGVPAVMMSHVTFPALGPLSASLEAAAYELLRSFGFDGVVITDAVNMSAIGEERPLAEAAVMALAAGADLVLATPGDQVESMRDAIVAAVADGRLPEPRLDEAVARVLELRGEDRSTMICG